MQKNQTRGYTGTRQWRDFLSEPETHKWILMLIKIIVYFKIRTGWHVKRNKSARASFVIRRCTCVRRNSDIAPSESRKFLSLSDSVRLWGKTNFSFSSEKLRKNSCIVLSKWLFRYDDISVNGISADEQRLYNRWYVERDVYKRISFSFGCLPEK